MRLLIIIFISTLIFSCNKNPSSPEGHTFLGSRSFAFTSNIDMTTLNEEMSITLYSSFAYTRDDSYTIQSNADLAAFNLLVDASEQVTLSELGGRNYFFFRGPLCPDYYKYNSHSYSGGGTLNIEMDHYNRDYVNCTAVMYDHYYVFSANRL